MNSVLEEVYIPSDKVREDVFKGNICLEELNSILLRDIKVIYQIYHDLRDSADSLPDIDAVFLRDIKSIYQIFLDIRGHAQPMRLECTRSK